MVVDRSIVLLMNGVKSLCYVLPGITIALSV